MFSRWYFASYIYEVSSLITWFVFSYCEWCISISFLFYCRWIYQCFPLELVPRLAYLKYIHFPSSVQFSHSVVSNSLRPHGLQHARPPCPSPTPGACSNSCPPSQWCHPTISSCRPLLLPPLVFPSIRVFSNESVLHIRWPKHWSFSFSIHPSPEAINILSQTEL